MAATGTLETRPVRVLADGGDRIGRLVFIGDLLVAVIVELSGSDTGESEDSAGWYLEAGFGPCSLLMTIPPDVFSREDDALAWISQRVLEAP